jgi:hypothetical protein
MNTNIYRFILFRRKPYHDAVINEINYPLLHDINRLTIYDLRY